MKARPSFRRFSRKAWLGLTLVELLVAMSVLLVMMTFLAGMVGFGFRVVDSFAREAR